MNPFEISDLADRRRRAAAAYDGGLPEGAELVRVWKPRDPSELRGRLGDGRLAAWAEDDVLHILWRGAADRVILGGGVQAPMWPADGADGLWEASWRVRRLDEAVITVMVLPLRGTGVPFGRPVTEFMTWRGPCAPPEPAAGGPLAGEIREHVLDSAALRGPRAVSVYVPPGDFRGAPLPGCVLADGQSAAAFARALDPAIVSGAAPPVLLVGVHSGGKPGKLPDQRAREYVPGTSPRRFAAHLSFVTEEVIPWAVSSFPVRRGPWLAAGYSNGAVWAIGAAQRRPDVFGGVAGLSPGVVPRRVARASRGVRHYLAAGTLEENFRRSTREWAERLARAGVPCVHHEWVGGHDSFWWERSLPEALAWLLSSEE